MKVKIVPSMTWNEAPDTIGIKELQKILGIGKDKAIDMFYEHGFPKIPGAGLKADKEAARLFLQGIKIKDDSKTAINYLILLELKKLNAQISKEGFDELYVSNN